MWDGRVRGKPVMFSAIEQTCPMHVKLELAVEVALFQNLSDRILAVCVIRCSKGLLGLLVCNRSVARTGPGCITHSTKVSGMQPALSTRDS